MKKQVDPTKNKFVVIMGDANDKPKLLHADVSPRQLYEAQSQDIEILLYSAPLEFYRTIKKKSNGEAIKALETAFISTPLGSFPDVYPVKPQEAGL